MIFAISAVTRYRANLTAYHPYGYYQCALRWIDKVPLLGSADAIQNLLLVARFGMYYHVGISIWDVAQCSMRQCIELGYHASPATLLGPVEEQKRRRVFWECYIIDRYSSAVLGRPFAIADSEVSVSLPVAANDEVIQTAATSALSDIPTVPTATPTELSVFVFYIKLRRISSRIRTEFYIPRRSRSGPSTPLNISSVGHAQIKVEGYLNELNRWRLEAPVFAQPASLYERPEWYDYLLETDKLALLRAAMHMAPKRRNNRPSPRLLQANLEAATRAIELYAGMLEKGLITWTRNYFQTIFASGLSVIYCLYFGPTESDRVADLGRYWNILDVCSRVLEVFRREMPDAGIFATIFMELKAQFLQKRAVHPGVEQNVQRSNQEPGDNAARPPVEHDQQSAFGRSGGNGLLSGISENDLGPQVQDEQDLFLSQDIIQSIEEGLGQYAWGFPGDDLFNFDLGGMDL